MADPDPFWHHGSQWDPLDPENPELDITLPLFVNRPVYMAREITIQTHNVTLFKGLMVNGTIKG
jgi:hypothetical protein